MTRVSLFFIAAVSVPAFLFAHGDGITYSATTAADSGEMRVIDVDYNDADLTAGTLGRFDFKLFSDTERTMAVPFTDLWVRIEERSEEGRGAMLFAGPIAKVDLGGAGLSIVFPEGGEYTLSVRYNDSRVPSGDAVLAEAEFPLTVLSGLHERKPYLTPEFWIGFMSSLVVVLVGAGIVVSRSKFS